jgi:hypothetical protein
MRPFEQGKTRQSVVTVQHAGSGATWPPSKAHSQSTGDGNVADMDGTTSNYSGDTDSGSVLTETQLRYLSRLYGRSQMQWIAIPDTRTSGVCAMLAFDLSAWHPSIRSLIRQQLMRMGGVPFESRPPNTDNPEKSFVLQVMRGAIKSTVLRAEHATGVVNLDPNQT